MLEDENNLKVHKSCHQHIRCTLYAIIFFGPIVCDYMPITPLYELRVRVQMIQARSLWFKQDF